MPITVEIHTDGGCRNNQISDKSKVVGGWGVILRQPTEKGLREKELYGGKDGFTTNNEMELTAIYKALSALKRKDVELNIYMDSKYCYQIFTEWISTWKRNGWRKKGGAIQNLELIKDIHELLNSFQTVHMYWEKGHANNELNNRVDALVNKAMDEVTAQRNTIKSF